MQQSPYRRFTFHNAGQGLFFSGNVCGFEFVYDCGSVRKQHLTDIVLNYKHALPRGKLDLLILSHLHEDHVSGLYALFHRRPKTSVDLVILPYLSLAERLILAIRADGRPTGDWYYTFLSDPVRFFADREVKQIMYLGDSEPDNRAENPERREDEQPRRFMDKLKDSSTLRNRVLNDEPHLGYFSPKKLKFKTHDGAIMVSPKSAYWQFRFFNYNVGQAKIRQFLDCLRSVTNVGDIRAIITDSKKRESLRGCYRSLSKTDFNNTSLLVLHGPVDNQELVPLNGQSQLLTGDINLKGHISEIRRHFGSDLSNVGLCLIPHHGSRRNWDRAILSCLSCRCRWVVSTGRSSKSQPCDDILNNITGYGHSYSICNDDNPVAFW